MNLHCKSPESNEKIMEKSKAERLFFLFFNLIFFSSCQLRSYIRTDRPIGYDSTIQYTMFSPISSPVPFPLGNSYPSPLPKAGGYTYASPMAKLLTTPRSYLRSPHVNPLSQRIGITRQVTGNSLPGMTALTSMTKLSRSVEEASANSKSGMQWKNNLNPRSEFFTSVFLYILLCVRNRRKMFYMLVM